jgi:hypothetical protein
MLHQILFWGGMSALIGISMFLGKLQSENDVRRRGLARRKYIREKHQEIRVTRAIREADEAKTLAPAEGAQPCCADPASCCG